VSGVPFCCSPIIVYTNSLNFGCINEAITLAVSLPCSRDTVALATTPDFSGGAQLFGLSKASTAAKYHLFLALHDFVSVSRTRKDSGRSDPRYLHGDLPAPGTAIVKCAFVRLERTDMNCR
jgi:hypothetical protein